MTAETPRPLQPDPIRQTDPTKSAVGTWIPTEADHLYVARIWKGIDDWREKVSKRLQVPSTSLPQDPHEMFKPEA